MSPRTVSKFFDTGELNGFKLPGSRDRRVTRNDLILFMRKNRIPIHPDDDFIQKDKTLFKGRIEDSCIQVNGQKWIVPEDVITSLGLKQGDSINLVLSKD